MFVGTGNTGCTRARPSRKHLECLLTNRHSSSSILRRLGIRIPPALSEARLPLLLTTSQKPTAFCDPCELPIRKQHVISQSHRRNTRLEYHGLLRNHPRSQLVDG